MKNFSILFTLFFLSTGLAFSNDSLTAALDKKDPLYGVAKNVGTLLGDGNISTGTSELWANKLAVKVPRGRKRMKKLMWKLFKQNFEQVGEIPENAKVSVKVTKFNKQKVRQLVDALIEGNAYNPDNKETVKDLSRMAWAVLRRLPVNKNTTVGVVTARLQDMYSKEWRNIYHFVFLNKKNKKVVQAFVIEGTM